MKQKWQSLKIETRMIASAAIISLVVISAACVWHPAEDVGNSRADVPGIDTFIPKGQVLIPIDVQNYEALDSILEKFGMVDLFKNRSEGGRLIARNVRLLRAPQNPSRFAVLVEEAQAPRILDAAAPIFVVVKPPSKSGTEFVDIAHRGRRIIFEGD